MPPWRVLLWFKLTEVVLQARPKAIYRTYFHRHRRLREAMRWYTRIGRRVWPYEIWQFLRSRRLKNGPTVAAFWGDSQVADESAMATARQAPKPLVQDAA